MYIVDETSMHVQHSGVLSDPQLIVLFTFFYPPNFCHIKMKIKSQRNGLISFDKPVYSLSNALDSERQYQRLQFDLLTITYPWNNISRFEILKYSSTFYCHLGSFIFSFFQYNVISCVTSSSMCVTLVGRNCDFLKKNAYICILQVHDQ